MGGALLVAGDAAYKQFGCCTSRCNYSPPPCCATQPTPSSDCCSTKQPECCEAPSACCLLTAKSAAKISECCNATYTYCTRTETINVGCCCEVVDGRFRCLLTGEISDECCCVPIE
jgi:hypothetical protein